MGKNERLGLIKQIEEERGTKVIAYLTSARPGREAQMAMDCIPIIYSHLRDVSMPKGEKAIDLFLFSNGGNGVVPWRLVTLMREYAKENSFSVLIPHRAYSAATLTALGADHIIMHPMGILGPTDPTVTTDFNPPDETRPGIRKGISVEDVLAYLALVKEDAGIKSESEIIKAFSILAEKVHPLALGHVKRIVSQSKMMAKKLLGLHMDAEKHTKHIDEIVDNLTTKLFYHGHPINRKEAKEAIKLTTVEYPSDSLEEKIWQLYLDYEEEMMMNDPWKPALEYMQYIAEHSDHTGPTPIVKMKLAFIESSAATDCCISEYQLIGNQAPDGSTQVNVIIGKEGWSRE